MNCELIAACPGLPQFDIANEARTWVGTKFVHQARLKGVGVDCGGVLIGVARALRRVAPDFDIKGYPRTPDGKSLLEHCDRWMTRISKSEMTVGDVIVIRWAHDPQHIGIVGDYLHGGLSMIHAFSDPDGNGSVIEHHLDASYLKRFVAAYRLPGVIE